jgi:hypothetical protein
MAALIKNERDYSSEPDANQRPKQHEIAGFVRRVNLLFERAGGFDGAFYRTA